MKAQLPDITAGYTVAGDGPAVVLVHGLAEDRQSWADVQRRLHGYRTYAVDLRGHGETTLGQPEGTLAQLGADLIQFLESVSGPAACVGYSLGGTVAFSAASKRPDLVRHLVVAGTSSVVGRAAVGFFEARIKGIQANFAAFAKDLRADTAAQLICATDQLDAVTQRRLEAINDGRGYVNAARAMVRVAAEPLTPLLATLRCPVDVIYADGDLFCPRKAVDILVDALPDVACYEIRGAGHLMSIDQPVAYANAIQTTLNSRRNI